MEKPDKYYIEIEKKLGSGKVPEILKTLGDIRSRGRASIIPLVLLLLEQDHGKEITDEIFNILSELKNKDCVPFIIEAIQSDKFEKYTTRLITTCWQSGLDYSDHLVVFAEQFIKGDYQMAIEAFSVIEEWIFESQPVTIKECKKYLIDAVDRISSDKKPLYIELVKVVESHL